MAPRIAHVISTAYGMGGAERVLAALVAGGEERGWEQLVLNPYATDPASCDLRRASGTPLYEGFRCSRLVNVPSTLAWVRGRLQQFRPDIVHAHLHQALLTVAAVAPRRASLVLTHHHGNVLEIEGRHLEDRLDRIASRRFDHVVGVSNWVSRYLVEQAGYPPSKVVAIPNGWHGRPPPDVGVARVPTIVCVANFRRGKGHDTVVRAFATVVESFPDSELLLVGSGELQASIMRLAEELGVAKQVHFLGYVPDVWPVLGRAHVLAHASRYETLGIAVLEAMAAGLPVVATAVGGIPELVRPGVTGELVAPGEHVALAAALVALLADTEKRRSMGEAARAFAASRTMMTTVDRYFDLYDRIIGARSIRRKRL